MNLVFILYIAILFVLLTPGILLTLPPNSTKLVAAVVHGVIFAIILHFTHKLVWDFAKKF
jgi:hypothetical protein